jgi:ABC-type glycerol-3-phosphate transport system substrate-binding protein
MKHVVAAALLVLLVCSVVFSEGKQEGKETKKLTVLLERWWPRAFNDTFMQAAKDFEAQKGIQVDLQLIGGDERDTKILVGIETGALPDISTSWSQGAPLWYPAGVLENVDDVVADLEKEHGKVFGLMKQFVFFDGSYYGVPWFSIPDGLHVRSDRIEAAGLALPDTWDDVLTIAKKTTDRANKVYGFGEGPSALNADHGKFFRSMLYSYGGSIYGKDAKSMGVDSPATVEVLKWIKEAWDAGAIPPDGPQWDSGGNNRSWISGEGTMIWNAASTVWASENQAPELAKKMAIAKCPAGPKGRMMYSDINTMVIFNTSKNIEAAKEFVKWFLNPEYYKKGAIPIGQPCYEKHATDPVWDHPLYRPFVESLPFMVNLGYPGPVSPQEYDVFSRGLLREMSQNMVVFNARPEDALKSQLPKFQSVLKRWVKE